MEVLLDRRAWYMRPYISVLFQTTLLVVQFTLSFNNPVAFTTDPRSGRSSQYCTDVANALDAPIFHVNGDDIDAVVHVLALLAVKWPQTLHFDVVVDIVLIPLHFNGKRAGVSYTPASPME